MLEVGLPLESGQNLHQVQTDIASLLTGATHKENRNSTERLMRKGTLLLGGGCNSSLLYFNGFLNSVNSVVFQYIYLEGSPPPPSALIMFLNYACFLNAREELF